MGEKILDIIRVVYNKILYFILGVFSACVPKLSVFPGTNGDCITFRWDNYVYKYWNIFFLNPNRSFSRFKEIHTDLKAAGLDNIPKFSLGWLSVKYEFVQSRDLLSVLKDSNREEKMRIVKKVLSEIDQWHQKGFAHIDFKPKNILIGVDERIYFIDFENVTKNPQKVDYSVDYEKLLPRIIYFFEHDELLEVMNGSSERFTDFASKYIRDFDYKEILGGFDWIDFEKEAYDEHEDVDITVDSYKRTAVIIENVKKNNLDYFLFFRSKDDIKLYVFNLKKLILIDIHINQPLSLSDFLKHKLWKDPSTQIALTGPDGVGKTTLLERVTSSHVRGIDFEVLHAGRFMKGQRVFPHIFLLERILNKLSLDNFSVSVLYQKVLRSSTKPLLLLDRSFFDTFINRPGNFHHVYFLWLRIFLPKKVKIVLLKDNPQAIADRKNEMSVETIERYYMYAENKFPLFASIENSSQDDVLYKFTAIVRYLRFTQRSFL